MKENKKKTKNKTTNKHQQYTKVNYHLATVTFQSTDKTHLESQYNNKQQQKKNTQPQ